MITRLVRLNFDGLSRGRFGGFGDVWRLFAAIVIVIVVVVIVIVIVIVVVVIIIVVVVVVIGSAS